MFGHLDDKGALPQGWHLDLLLAEQDGRRGQRDLHGYRTLRTRLQRPSVGSFRVPKSFEELAEHHVLSFRHFAWVVLFAESRAGGSAAQQFDSVEPIHRGHIRLAAQVAVHTVQARQQLGELRLACPCSAPQGEQRELGEAGSQMLLKVTGHCPAHSERCRCRSVYFAQGGQGAVGDLVSLHQRGLGEQVGRQHNVFHQAVSVHHAQGVERFPRLDVGDNCGASLLLYVYAGSGYLIDLGHVLFLGKDQEFDFLDLRIAANVIDTAQPFQGPQEGRLRQPGRLFHDDGTKHCTASLDPAERPTAATPGTVR